VFASTEAHASSASTTVDPSRKPQPKSKRQQRSVVGESTNKTGGDVNKQELIDTIAKSADISKAAAGRALDGSDRD